MEIISKQRRELSAQYAQEIKFVSAYLSRGLNPLLLDSLGQNDQASSLRFAIGLLSENEILFLAENQARHLRQKEIDKQTKKKDQQSPAPTLSKHPKQANFFHLFNPQKQEDLKVKKPQEKNIEATIDKWHQAFNGKGNNKLKNQILGYEAQREWAQLKKELGLTQKAKTEKIQRQAVIAIKRLKEAGVIDKLFQQLGQADREQLIIQLQKFDLSQKKPWVDPYSSDGFAIYPSEESYINALEQQ